jgi:cation diffusion facilitator CzcD-associated flavoprotein CzcO
MRDRRDRMAVIGAGPVGLGMAIRRVKRFMPAPLAWPNADLTVY